MQSQLPLTEGGAGDPPAPPGDPPGGVIARPGCEKTALFLSMPRSIPSGGSPDGTGESPVLPAVNTCLKGAGQGEVSFRLHRDG